MQNSVTGFWTLPASLSKEGIFHLKEMAVVEVSGADAMGFLHGQFTNHINEIGDAFRLAAYCQPQGRILSLMRVVKKDDLFYLIMPQDLIEGFIKRLSMFILRSKVSIRLADELAVFGVILQNKQLPDIDHAVIDNDMVIGRVSNWSNLQRALLVANPEKVLNQMQVTEDSAMWFLSEIETSTPWVFEKTKEAFIPQWINLDLIGGLVFDKGCYPGQEIISRMQHLGKTPRRLALLKSDSKVLVEPKSDVFLNGEAVGQAVMSVQLHGKTLVLVSMSDKNSDQKDAFEIKNKQFLRLYDK